MEPGALMDLTLHVRWPAEVEQNLEHELVPIQPHQEVAAHVVEAVHKVSPVILTRAQLLLVVNRNRIYLDFEPNFIK